MANTLPGISGGSIALILGVYEPLIKILAQLDLKNLIAIRKKKDFNDLINRLEPLFMIPILSGVLLGIFLFSSFMPSLVSKYPTHINALFFGLIIGSIPYTYSLIKEPLKPIHFLLLSIFMCITLYALNLDLLFSSSSIFSQFICGIFAICSMLLPGISGGFILVLFGNYQFIIKEIAKIFYLDLSAIINLAPFILGVALGGLLFIKLINYLLNSFRVATLSSLIGILLASLNPLWPFKANSNLLVSNKIFITLLIIAGVILSLLTLLIKQKNNDQSS